MGWASLKNGQLLALAGKEFGIFLALGRSLSSQQHLPKFNIAVLILAARSNRFADLQVVAPNILAATPKLERGGAATIVAKNLVNLPVSNRVGRAN